MKNPLFFTKLALSFIKSRYIELAVLFGLNLLMTLLVIFVSPNPLAPVVDNFEMALFLSVFSVYALFGLLSSLAILGMNNDSSLGLKDSFRWALKKFWPLIKVILLTVLVAQFFGFFNVYLSIIVTLILFSAVFLVTIDEYGAFRSIKSSVTIFYKNWLNVSVNQLVLFSSLIIIFNATGLLISSLPFVGDFSDYLLKNTLNFLFTPLVISYLYYLYLDIRPPQEQ